MLAERLRDWLGLPRAAVQHCVLLTGPPRSSTTLTCHLLNRLPDTVALHEPMKVEELAKAGSPDRALRVIDRFLRDTRRSLLEQGLAPTKHVAGRVPDNPFDDTRNETGLRKDLTERGLAHFEKPLTDDFLLVVKHPAVFAGMLPHLGDYPVFAAVRNPLSVLCSWNTIDRPVYQGRVPAAEGVDAELKRTLDGIPERLDRQLYLLDWFFARFQDGLPPERILRYEDTVESGGRNLAVLTPRAAELDEELESRNQNKSYGPELMKTLSERLLASEGAYWKLYEREWVRELIPA